VTSARSDRALFLAAVAVLGLVVTPLLHAEEHFREEQEEESASAALALAFRAGSSDPLEALAAALAQGHEQTGDRQGHRHSHGEGTPSDHGAGVLAHFKVALHAAPALPAIGAAAAEPAPPAPIVAQLRGTLSYLIPEGSQGPPACG